MGKDTAISWTRHTFNPWWGCAKVSPGCAHCYAESFAKRTGNAVWGEQAERRFFGDKHWNEPMKWNSDAAKAGERRRVFCASMADWLEDREDLTPHLMRLLVLIQSTPHLDWLLLSKRPENFAKRIQEIADGWQSSCEMAVWWTRGVAPENVWLGTTVENQEMADKRIPELLKIPAKVRFLSCEPLLGPVDLRTVVDWWNSDEKIHWVIAGGESGPGFREFNPEWARSLRDQCKSAHVAFHMKQMGGLKPTMMPPIPEDLMIREWPQYNEPWTEKRQRLINEAFTIVDQNNPTKTP